MTQTFLKCTTRHVRIFTARTENNELVDDPNFLTLDLDPDNEFLWTEEVVSSIQEEFTQLVDSQQEQELSDYTLRRIGTILETKIRKLLQAGQISYNPDCRVLNYSMGLPRTKELL